MMLLQLRKRRCKQGRRSTSVWKEKEKGGEGGVRDGGMRRGEGAREEGTASSPPSELGIPLHSLSHLAVLGSGTQHPQPHCACTHTHTHMQHAASSAHGGEGQEIERESMRRKGEGREREREKESTASTALMQRSPAAAG